MSVVRTEDGASKEARSARFELRVKPSLLVRIDAVRGEASRASFVELAVEQRLAGCVDPGGTPLAERVRASIAEPSRSPAKPEPRAAYVRPFNPIPKGGR